MVTVMRAGGTNQAKNGTKRKAKDGLINLIDSDSDGVEDMELTSANVDVQKPNVVDLLDEDQEMLEDGATASAPIEID